MAGDWLKINRSILKWGWYKDANTMRVFIDILLHTNYEDGEYMGHPVKIGQCVIGRKELAERLGISEQSVRTALKHLQKTKEITIKSTNKFSIATITNWAIYQEKDDNANQQTNQQLTNNQPTTNQQLTTSKKVRREEGKKERIDIYTPEYEEIVGYLNEMCGTSYRASSKKTQSLIRARLNEGYRVDDFKAVIYKKGKQWVNDPKMCKFLRPETLFSNKFEGYLNERESSESISRWEVDF